MKLIHYKQWSDMLKTCNLRDAELLRFETEMVELYGDNIFDVWTRWSEKLQKLGLYK